jgi:glycosyltransferase 2 family protein
MEAEKTYTKYTVRRMVKFVILVFFIGLVVNTIITFLMDHRKVLEIIRTVRFDYFLIPFVCYLGWNFIDAVRLRIVTSQFGVKIPFKRLFFNSVLGTFFNNLTPMAAGGQPFQIYHLKTLGLKSKTATNIILSRFVEQAGIIVCILIVSIPKIIRVVKSMQMGSVLIYIGLGTTFCFSLLFVLILIRPDAIGKMSMGIYRTAFGRFIGRITKRPDWAEKLHIWTEELRHQVAFLWTEKLHIMLIDIVGALAIILIQGFSLYYLLHNRVAPSLTYLDVTITFVIIWQVVFYIPTPGASGTIEGGFSLVFAGLTKAPELTFTMIVVWRLSSYYAHIIFGGIVFGIYMKRKGKKQIKGEIDHGDTDETTFIREGSV